MHEGGEGQERKGKECMAGTLEGDLELVDVVIFARAGGVTLEKELVRTRTQRESKRERGTQSLVRERLARACRRHFVRHFFRAEHAGDGGRGVYEREGGCEVQDTENASETLKSKKSCGLTGSAGLSWQ